MARELESEKYHIEDNFFLCSERKSHTLFSFYKKPNIPNPTEHVKHVFGLGVG